MAAPLLKGLKAPIIHSLVTEHVALVSVCIKYYIMCCYQLSLVKYADSLFFSQVPLIQQSRKAVTLIEVLGLIVIDEDVH